MAHSAPEIADVRDQDGQLLGSRAPTATEPRDDGVGQAAAQIRGGHRQQSGSPSYEREDPDDVLEKHERLEFLVPALAAGQANSGAEGAPLEGSCLPMRASLTVWLWLPGAL